MTTTGQILIVREAARREAFKEVGKWLESTITDDSPERLDEPFPVKVTGLDILKMRDAGLLPKGVGSMLPSETKD